MEWFLRITHLIRSLVKLSIIKTIIFNFRNFEFRTACLLPVFIYKHTECQCRVGGGFKLEAPPKTGMIQIGRGTGGFCKKSYSTKLCIKGCVVFKGSAIIFNGCHINVSQNGILTLGDKFELGCLSNVFVSNSITFGDDCLLSWNIDILDSDMHGMYDLNSDNLRNPSKPIKIGEHVWVGCRTLILKGVVIPDNTIVAASSTLRGTTLQMENTIIGDDCKILKKNITWKRPLIYGKD